MSIRMSIQRMTLLATASLFVFCVLPAQANDEGEKQNPVQVREIKVEQKTDDQGDEVREQLILVDVDPNAQADDVNAGLKLAVEGAAVAGNEKRQARILRINAAPAGDILTVQAQGDVAAGQLLAQLEGPGKYWIGIHIHEVSPALQSQLNLEEGHGILIGEVSPDSPASKAGVKQHDILLGVGDTKISKNEDLLKAIKDADGKEIKLKVLRGGSERIVAVTPTARPEEKFTVVAPEEDTQDVFQWVQKFQPGTAANLFQPNANLEFNVVKPSPGFVLPGATTLAGGRAELPEDLSITVTREGKKPAKISIKQKERDIEITEDKIHELPEDVRRFVEPMLGRQRASLNLRTTARRAPAPRAFPPPAPQVQPLPPGQPGKPGDVLLPAPPGQEERRIRVRALPPGQRPDGVEQRIDALERRLEELQRAVRGSEEKKEESK